jgi:hypothetical protein
MTTTIDLKDHEARIKALESKITALESRRIPKIRMERYVLSWEGRGDSDNWFGHATNDKVQKINGNAVNNNNAVDGFNTGVRESDYNKAMMSYAWKTHNYNGTRFFNNKWNGDPGNFCTLYLRGEGIFRTWRIAIDADEVDDVWDVSVIFLNV